MTIEQPLKYIFSTLRFVFKLLIKKRWELFACFLLFLVIILALLQIPYFQYKTGKARLRSDTLTSMVIGTDVYGPTNYFIEMAAKNGYLKAQEDTAYRNLRPVKLRHDDRSRLTATEYWYTKTVNNPSQDDYDEFYTATKIKKDANIQLQKIKIYRKTFREALKGNVAAQFKIALWVDQQRLPRFPEKFDTEPTYGSSEGYQYLPLMLIAAEKNYLPAMEQIILSAQRKREISHLSGQKGDLDIEMAWLHKAAKLNSHFAQFRLGEYYLDTKENEKAIKWLTLVVKSKTNKYTTQALEALIYAYEENIKNPLYLKYVREASERGSKRARRKLLLIYLNGEIVPRNLIIAHAIVKAFNYKVPPSYGQISDDLYRDFQNLPHEDKQIITTLSKKMMEPDNYLKAIDAMTDKGNSNGVK